MLQLSIALDCPVLAKQRAESTSNAFRRMPQASCQEHTPEDTHSPPWHAQPRQSLAARYACISRACTVRLFLVSRLWLAAASSLLVAGVVSGHRARPEGKQGRARVGMGTSANSSRQRPDAAAAASPCSTSNSRAYGQVTGTKAQPRAAPQNYHIVWQPNAGNINGGYTLLTACWCPRRARSGPSPPSLSALAGPPHCNGTRPRPHGVSV